MIHKNYLKLGVIWWICNESLYCDQLCKWVCIDISEHQGRWSMWNHKEYILEVCTPRWHAFSALFIFRESKWGHRLNQPLPPLHTPKFMGLQRLKAKLPLCMNTVPWSHAERLDVKALHFGVQQQVGVTIICPFYSKGQNICILRDKIHECQGEFQLGSREKNPCCCQ